MPCTQIKNPNKPYKTDYELMFSNLFLIGHINTWRARSTTFITNNPCLAATLREEQSTVTINAYKVL